MFSDELIVKGEDNREENYRYMVEAVRGLTESEPDLIANLSNISALIFAYMDSINWAGFYILRGGELVLGPFQGKPACLRIKLGKGVCGTAAAEGRIITVQDVHQFPGHIACDAESNSEIVLPIFKGTDLFGVLDIDSPVCGRFGKGEETALAGVVALLEELLNEK